MAAASGQPDIAPLVENAFDFLHRALDEFDTHPKYSVIHFYTAVELFLKARLQAEHWSLVVANHNQLNRAKFDQGDFVSVNLEEAANRLDKAVQAPLSDDDIRVFNGLRKHRNRMVHFFHDATREGDQREIQNIAREQLRAWFALHTLLARKWSAVFQKWIPALAEIEKKLRKHREFLNAIFEDKKPEIEKARAEGIEIVFCPSCAFDALLGADETKPLQEVECCVCEFSSVRLAIECTKCGEQVEFFDDGFGRCECGEAYDPQSLATALNDFVWQKDDPATRLPAHCAECDGFETVISSGGKLFCVGCFQQWDWEDIAMCDWCSDPNTGDMSDSNFHGCNVCDGAYGHHMSKND